MTMRILWAVAGPAVVLVGCSSPAPTQPPAAAANATPARKLIAPAAPEPAISSGELARLRAPFTGDLDAVVARGHVRVLVVPSRTQYSIENGHQRGATLDAGKAFEAFLNSTLATGAQPLKVVFIPVRNDALVADLNAGHGDIAANLVFTFERDDQIAFSEPVRKGVRELIVTGPGVPPLVSLEDVAGRAIHVRRSSDHHTSLVRLNAQLAKAGKPACTIVVADEALTDEDVLERVNAGQIPATVVDDYLYEVLRTQFDKVAVNQDVAVSQDGVVAWATRKDSPKLAALVNEFVKSHDLSGPR